jgi:hypothetical protein
MPMPFILFPSMGVWAMRSRLRYHIQPLYQPGMEAELVQIEKTSSGEKIGTSSSRFPNAIACLPRGTTLREKLQSTITQLLSK